MFTDHPDDLQTTIHIDTCKKFARDEKTEGIIKLVFNLQME
jgi:hypothetical protein